VGSQDLINIDKSGFTGNGSGPERKQPEIVVAVVEELKQQDLSKAERVGSAVALNSSSGGSDKFKPPH
jgi:hypothetical protein